MVNTAIADFTDGVTADATDRIAAARSPFGIGDDRWISPQYIKDYLLALASSFSANGAASTPPVSLTGTWFTGGSSTTTKPHFLVQPTGTTSTGWSTSGTGLGINAASGFTGNLADLQLNGVSKFNVLSTGTISWAGTTFLQADAANSLGLRNGANAQAFNVYNTFTDASNNELVRLVWAGNKAYLQTLSVGTGTARDIVIQAGSGNLLIGNNNMLFQTDNTYDIGAAGATRPRRIYASGFVVTQSTTVAGLTAAATAGSGARAFVTDATATTFLSVVAGGGANKVPVVSDGTNWLIG